MVIYRSRKSVIGKYLKLSTEGLIKERNRLNRELQSTERQRKQQTSMWIEDQDIIYDWNLRDLCIISVISYCKMHDIYDIETINKKIKDALPLSDNLLER